MIYTQCVIDIIRTPWWFCIRLVISVNFIVRSAFLFLSGVFIIFGVSMWGDSYILFVISVWGDSTGASNKQFLINFLSCFPTLDLLCFWDNKNILLKHFSFINWRPWFHLTSHSHHWLCNTCEPPIDEVQIRCMEIQIWRKDIWFKIWYLGVKSSEPHRIGKN